MTHAPTFCQDPDCPEYGNSLTNGICPAVEHEPDTYNGWRNYETWAVGMYLDGNYDGPAIHWAAIEAVRNVDPTEESGRRYLVADALKDLVEEYVNPHMVDDDHPDPNFHPLVADLLGASLSSVDWYELADAWIEIVAEQEVYNG